MTEDEMRRETRLIALEYAWAHTYNIFLKLVGADEGVIGNAETANAEVLRANTVRDADPAISDMMADEIHQSMERLWLIAREMREAERA